LSIYALKPKFQSLLRPLTSALARAGITANQVTLAAAIVSIAVGVFIAWRTPERWPFLLIPLWMFLRMAFNAIDGMLAREFGQKSRLGAYLNELTDVISDSFLYLPFALIAPFSPLYWPSRCWAPPAAVGAKRTKRPAAPRSRRPRRGRSWRPTPTR